MHKPGSVNQITTQNPSSSGLLEAKETLSDAIFRQGYCVIDRFLEDNDYATLCSLAKHLNEQGEFRSGRVGNTLHLSQHETIRKDSILWLDKQGIPATTPYFQAIRQVSEDLNQTLFLGLTDFEAHFAFYSAGSFYKKHRDQFANQKERRISCVYYLNSNWLPSYGGALKLYDASERLLVEVLPEGNRFICFESNLLHEVCTAYQPRYSIAGWLRVRALTAS